MIGAFYCTACHHLSESNWDMVGEKCSGLNLIVTKQIQESIIEITRPDFSGRQNHLLWNLKRPKKTDKWLRNNLIFPSAISNANCLFSCRAKKCPGPRHVPPSPGSLSSLPGSELIYQPGLGSQDVSSSAAAVSSERGPGLRLGFSGPRYFNIHANRGKLTGMPTGTRSRDQRQTPIGEQEDVMWCYGGD